VLCTTLGREAEGSHGRSKEIIETNPGNRATMGLMSYPMDMATTP